MWDLLTDFLTTCHICAATWSGQQRYFSIVPHANRAGLRSSSVAQLRVSSVPAPAQSEHRGHNGYSVWYFPSGRGKYLGLLSLSTNVSTTIQLWWHQLRQKFSWSGLFFPYWHVHFCFLPVQSELTTHLKLCIFVVYHLWSFDRFRCLRSAPPYLPRYNTSSSSIVDGTGAAMAASRDS